MTGATGLGATGPAGATGPTGTVGFPPLIAAAFVTPAGPAFDSNFGFTSISQIAVGHYRLVLNNPPASPTNTIVNALLARGVGGQITWSLSGSDVDIFVFDAAGTAQNGGFTITVFDNT